MIIRKTTAEDNTAVNALFAVAFESSPENGPAQENDTRIRHWGAFTDDGELMSSLSVTPFSIRFDGSVCPMAGIGAVQTLPPYRRRGGIAACFASALPELYADGYLFSYLFPFSTAFYRRFGYENCVTRIGCTLDLAQLRRLPDQGSFRLATKEAPLREAICAVDRVWETMWNMEVIRDDKDYGWLDKLDPLATKEYLYVCFDVDGTPIGYAAFHTAQDTGDRDLICSRLRFTGKAGFSALLGVFKSLAADHRHAVISLPSDPALPYLMGEWSLGAARFALQPAGMVRVIHAENVLARAVCRGEGELRFAIHDPLIAENNGIFSLRFSDGRTPEVKRTEEKPDAVMDIAAFSALIAGACDMDGAGKWMDGVQILNPSAPLASVFHRKSTMISAYF